MAKDVSSFANSAGGQIIYGIGEKNSCADFLDAGYDPKEFSPEWLGQIIATNISPRIQSLEIKAIPLLDGDGDRVAFVITIPQATVFAPHQNTVDNKYYRRFDCRAVPMADYEIRDVLLRARAPQIVVRTTFEDGAMVRLRTPRDASFEIIVEVENISAEPSLYTVIDLQIDSRLMILDRGTWKRKPNVTFENHEASVLQRRLMIPEDFPLVQHTHITFGPPEIIIMLPKDANESSAGEDVFETYFIATSIIAPGFKSLNLATLGYRAHQLSLSKFESLV